MTKIDLSVCVNCGNLSVTNSKCNTCQHDGENPLCACEYCQEPPTVEIPVQIA